MDIGWIGIGNMGKPMAKNVQTFSTQFTVNDLNQESAIDILESGGNWANSPAECAKGKDIIFMCLPMPTDVEKVCLGENGILEGIDSNTIVIDSSTNSLSMVKKLHEIFDKRGIVFMDCPVSGGVIGAVKKDLCVMAGGDKEIYNKIKPALDAMGDKVMYCGATGNGTICKLSHNLFSGLLMNIASEVLASGIKAGVDLTTLLEAISKGASGKNPPLANWINATQNDFAADKYSFFLELGAKDVKLACEMGRENKVPMDMSNILEQNLIEILNRGWGRKNSGILRKLIAEKAGIKFEYAPGGFA
jgi:3-hydroxyisobutyrate dehydrogenase|tara:strand:+ start:2955 stop:3866 length:912 start_codon:yes stop_codon:yes gene_type:complete